MAISMTPLANESNIQQALSSESPKLRETYNDYISQACDTNTSIQYYSRRQELIRYYMDFNKYYHKTFFGTALVQTMVFSMIRI
ncbi:22284_t:CDS:2 [Rhizophagus irregularis]|nr:22284_t:CDS:2 [Rhizophagus irregularis]